MIHPAIIDKLRKERERKEREAEEGRRLPLYLPELPPERRKPEPRETEYVIEF